MAHWTIQLMCGLAVFTFAVAAPKETGRVIRAWRDDGYSLQRAFSIVTPNGCVQWTSCVSMKFGLLSAIQRMQAELNVKDHDIQVLRIMYQQAMTEAHTAQANASVLSVQLQETQSDLLESVQIREFLESQLATAQDQIATLQNQLDNSSQSQQEDTGTDGEGEGEEDEDGDEYEENSSEESQESLTVEPETFDS